MDASFQTVMQKKTKKKENQQSFYSISYSKLIFVNNTIQNIQGVPLNMKVGE